MQNINSESQAISIIQYDISTNPFYFYSKDQPLNFDD